MKKNTYVIDAESATEMARLILQDRLVVQVMGGLFPEQSDLRSVRRVLDLGCGPGTWALDVARSYPKMQVTGTDLSTTMMTYARGMVDLHGLRNLCFLVMNALEPLLFDDQSFDLVNLRFGASFLPKNAWSPLLKECRRVTRRGGLIRLTEGDNLGRTSSDAQMQLNCLFLRMMHQAGYGFSADESTLGMTPILETLLQEAGCQDVRSRLFTLDFSFGTELYDSQFQNLQVVLRLLQPRLIEVAALDEIDWLYHRMLQEMRREDFRGMGHLLTAWGTV